MTAEVTSATGVPEESVSVSPPRPVPAPPRPVKARVDPDGFTRRARELAVENFNENRDPKRSRPLRVDQVYIVWFAKVLGHWKAIVGSSVARGMLWEVTSNGNKNEAYVDTYRKINNTVYPLAGENE